MRLLKKWIGCEVITIIWQGNRSKFNKVLVEHNVNENIHYHKGGKGDEEDCLYINSIGGYVPIGTKLLIINTKIYEAKQ